MYSTYSVDHATLSVHVIKAKKYLFGYLLHKMYWYALCLGPHNPHVKIQLKAKELGNSHT